MFKKIIDAYKVSFESGDWRKELSSLQEKKEFQINKYANITNQLSNGE
jgi:hypothetical protein